jgi:protein SCO1/2
MRRRDYLRAAGIAGAAGAAGCLGAVGSLGDSNPDVALGPPDREADPEDLPYPAWGQRVPDVSLPAPLSDRTVTFREVGQPFLVTFIYTHCMSVCPVLQSGLREVQIHSAQNGYADDVSFYPVTFDPERDTADALRAEAEKLNVDLSAGNWHYLRPAGRDRATAVVEDEFGVTFKRTKTDDGEPGYMFTHLGLVVLVNGDGYVERAYRPAYEDGGKEIRFDETRVISDLETVREA